MIVFDDVTITFGTGEKALQNISFVIGESEFVIVEGHSGAGKTSLMRAVIKDLPISHGKIIIDGDNLSKISPKNLPLLRRKISVIFQDFKLLARLAVDDERTHRHIKNKIFLLKFPNL